MIFRCFEVWNTVQRRVILKYTANWGLFGWVFICLWLCWLAFDPLIWSLVSDCLTMKSFRGQNRVVVVAREALFIEQIIKEFFKTNSSFDAPGSDIRLDLQTYNVILSYTKKSFDWKCMIFKCLDESQVFFFFYLCAKQSWLLLAMQSVPFSSRGIKQRYCVMMMIAEAVRQGTKWYIKLVLKETMKCMCCYLANQIVCILTIKCMCCCQSHKRCNSLAILWWSWPARVRSP